MLLLGIFRQHFACWYQVLMSYDYSSILAWKLLSVCQSPAAAWQNFKLFACDCSKQAVWPSGRGVQATDIGLKFGTFPKSHHVNDAGSNPVRAEILKGHPAAKMQTRHVKTLGPWACLCSLVKDYIDPLQLAYRRNRSTDDAVLYVLENIYSHLEKAGSSSVRLLFVDFSSAFNTI